jgi:4-hydroxybenzoate polyprenyltransferase
MIPHASTSSQRLPLLLILGDVLGLCRPRQWTKNSFVLAPLLFSGMIADPGSLLAGVTAFACFCLWSSAIYCWNDWLDAEADRQHPRKCQRPIAAGRLTPTFAVFLGLWLSTEAGLIAWSFLPPVVLLYGLLYLANSVCYCLVLKHRVIADVMSIAVGFVLRLMAGCAAIGVQPTSWILVCGFSLALLLGFGKRRLEIAALAEPGKYRSTLEYYSVDKLNVLLGTASSICLLTYMLYTMSPQTVALHHTDKLIYTVPFVAYGIFRYLFKVQEGLYDGPVEILLKDRIFLVNGLLWLGSVAAVLYVDGSLSRALR